MKQIIFFFFLATFSMSFSASASLPTRFILQQTAAKRSQLGSVKITSVVTRFSDGAPTDTQFTEDFIFDYSKRTAFSKIKDAQGKVLYVKDVSEKKRNRSPLVALLFTDRPDDLVTAVSAAGLPLPVEIEGAESPKGPPLKRLAGRFVWALRGSETQGTELWVEKDSFLPLKFIWRPENSEQWVEVSFDQYRSSLNFLYPSKTLVSIDKTTEMMVSIEQANALLKAGPAEKNIELGWTQAGQDVSQSTKALIEKYLSVFR